MDFKEYLTESHTGTDVAIDINELKDSFYKSADSQQSVRAVIDILKQATPADAELLRVNLKSEISIFEQINKLLSSTKLGNKL